MTSFPSRLRRLVQQYEVAKASLLEKLGCECDRKKAERPCDRCPHVENFELKVKEMLKKPP